MGIVTRIRDIKNLSSSERQIADYILKNPERVLSLNIRELSENTYTSAASVVRFCKKVCDGGFPQMKLCIASELNTFSVYSLPIQENNIAKPYDDVKTTAEKLRNLLTNAISETMILLDFKAIEKIAEKMKNAETIDIYGIVASHMVAEDFYYKLTRIGKNTHINQGEDMQLLQAKNSNPNHLSIIISYSGETKRMLEIAEILSRRGSSIVSVTGAKDCPLLKFAEYNIFVSSREDSVRVGAIASRTCMNYVLDVLFLYFYNSSYEDFSKLTVKTHIDKTY